MSCRTALYALSVAAIVTTAPAYAQESTSSSTTAAQVEAAPATAQDEGFIEKGKSWAERTQIIERLNGDIDGWFVSGGFIRRLR